MRQNSRRVCARCIRADKGDPVHQFGAENLLQLHEVPVHLPELTQIEEMLIARVHVFVEVRRVRGQQYQYKGDIVNFRRNTGKVYWSQPTCGYGEH